MLAKVEAAYPEEACGLLGGKDGRVKSHFPVTNTLHSKTRFNMEGKEMLAAFEWLDVNSQELTAIYHSHPDGKPEPSRTDIADDPYPGVVKIIIAGQPGAWHVSAYLIISSSETLPVEIHQDMATKFE